MFCALKHHGNMQYIGTVNYLFIYNFITKKLKQRKALGTICNMNDIGGGGGDDDDDDDNNNNNNNHSLIPIILASIP
jgi:hypothetical protein